MWVANSLEQGGKSNGKDISKISRELGGGDNSGGPGLTRPISSLLTKFDRHLISE